MPNYGVGADAVKEIMLNGGEIEYNLTLVGDVLTTGTWVKLGYTDKDAGGVLSDKQPEFKNVMVTGLTDAVKRKPGAREVTFKTTLKQVNLENLRIATGGQSADVSGSNLLAGKSQTPPKLRWRYSVKNPDDATMGKRVYIMLGEVIDSVEVQFADDKETGIALSIKAFECPDATYLAGAVSLEGFRYIVQNATV